MDRQTEYFQNKLDFELDPFDLFTAMQNGEDIIPVDNRKSAAYKKEHIPGAISLPHRGIDELSTGSLDKTKIYACYCKGIGCNASTRGALKLSMLGFRVKELFGGINSWKSDGYDTDGDIKNRKLIGFKLSTVHSQH
jgi:rhodanese-related sulfurtransferase